MEETGNFNRLAAELSLDERNKLLEKLSGQSSISGATLYEEAPQGESFEPEARYHKLPWFYKLWFSILSFFNNRTPVKVYEDYTMLQMYRNIENKFPGFYNFEKDILLPKFQEELIKLREGARFFYDALDASINRDRGGLLIFLGSLEMPGIHKLIIDETDPDKLSARYENLGEIELRQKAVKAMEDVLSGMSEEERNNMYRSSRSLYCLKQLSSFLFDRLVNSFIHDSTNQGSICPARSVRDQLLTLSDILFSLKIPPSIALLESLFVYVLMDRSKEQGFDMAAEMNKLLARAEAALEAIRDFNQEVPLALLMRCIMRDSNISPRNIGGGEDWYAQYRERWKAQLEEQYFTFTRNKRQRDLQNSFRYFFKGTNLRILENMGSEQNPDGLFIRGNFCLSFLQTFYSVVFMGEINRHIRPILIDGDFINKENKTEFTECYNNLIKLEDLIARFDRNIAPTGEYGKRYALAKNDMSSLPVKRRKTQIVQEEAGHEAEKIISQTKDALKGMIKILEGILQRSPDGKYDSLANLAFFNVKGVPFTDGINESLIQLKKTFQLLNDVEVMEAGR